MNGWSIRQIISPSGISFREVPARTERKRGHGGYLHGDVVSYLFEFFRAGHEIGFAVKFHHGGHTASVERLFQPARKR
jgi:hypothetical protein